MARDKRVSSLQRWRNVQAVLLRYGFDILIDQEDIREVRRFLDRHLNLTLGEFADRSVPERVRMMLQELGPTFVKLGQIVSSRSDLLPPDWIAELAKLQDDVAPFPYSQVREIIIEDLGAPPEELFAVFEETPVAAASIGQVHQAILPDRRLVVVKVQRPGIAPQVAADMDLMYRMARLIESNTSWGRLYGVTGILKEFERSLTLELDYTNEGRNADRLRRNMAGEAHIHVPFIYWHLVSPHVLTMERIQGFKINDLAALDSAGIDRKLMAGAFIHSIIKQVLIDGFFHADPHPGNVFVDPEEQSLTYLDLGMMGTLLEEQREQLSDLVMAALNRDSRELVRVVISLGTPYKPVREAMLRREINLILDKYMTAALDQISFSALLEEVIDVVFDNGLRLPHELSLGLKALMQAEDVAHSLDPDIQIIKIAQAVAQRILRQRFSPAAIVDSLRQDTREVLRLAKVLPRAVEQLLQQLESGKFQISLDIPEFEAKTDHLYLIANRLTAGLIIAGMLIGSAIAMGTSPHESWAFIPVLGVISFIASIGTGGVLVWSVFKDVWTINRLRSKRKKEAGDYKSLG